MQIYCLFLNRQKNSSKSLPSFIFESSTKELAHSVIFWFWLSDLRLTTELVADSNQLSNKVTAGMESPNGVIANCDNLPQSALETRILTIRGIQVMLDRDLAELYGVPTSRLNEQSKRNKHSNYGCVCSNATFPSSRIPCDDSIANGNAFPWIGKELMSISTK